jgi:hypothetical protein
MRYYVEGQVNRNPKTAPSILFAVMDQYANEDTDIEENVIVNNLDENMQMKMAAISRRKSTGILLLNAIRVFLVMSMRRIFDRERRTFPSSGPYSLGCPSRTQTDAYSLSAGTFCCKASSSTRKRPSCTDSQNFSTAQPERN